MLYVGSCDDFCPKKKFVFLFFLAIFVLFFFGSFEKGNFDGIFLFENAFRRMAKIRHHKNHWPWFLKMPSSVYRHRLHPSSIHEIRCATRELVLGARGFLREWIFISWFFSGYFSCSSPPRKPRSINGSAFVDNREGKKTNKKKKKKREGEKKKKTRRGTKGKDLQLQQTLLIVVVFSWSFVGNKKQCCFCYCLRTAQENENNPLVLFLFFSYLSCFF